MPYVKMLNDASRELGLPHIQWKCSLAPYTIHDCILYISSKMSLTSEMVKFHKDDTTELLRPVYINAFEQIKDYCDEQIEKLENYSRD